jgi:predicted phage baseplate assembly protein
MPTANRPGLTRLSYRVGTYATFLETMKATLAETSLVPWGREGDEDRIYPLRELTTRSPEDPAIAMLDAWATVADVLTFYQERIANEGYLPTALERRSILELARLVGYRLRPGVAASVHLAFTLEQGQSLEIPAGTRAQSLPGPGELPQPFETADPLPARSQWNVIGARLSRPSKAFPESLANDVLFLAGTSTNLKVNDPLLMGPSGQAPVFRKVRHVEPDNEQKRTKVTLEPVPVPGSIASAAAAQIAGFPKSPFKSLGMMLFDLAEPPSSPPASSQRLAQAPAETLAARSDALPKLLGELRPAIRPHLVAALRGVKVAAPTQFEVHALRVTAPLFGYNAPPQKIRIESGSGEFPPPPQAVPSPWTIEDETNDQVVLDNAYDKIAAGSWAVIRKAAGTPVTFAIDEVATGPRTAYDMSGRSTMLRLVGTWRDAEGGSFDDLIRKTVVYAQSERLELAEEPIDEHVRRAQIPLDGLYDGLEPGRYVIVSGERSDVPLTEGVEASELAMVASAIHLYDRDRPGDTPHTTLTLATPLSYRYKRDTVRVYANVVRATHGETRLEVLGGGNAAQSMQTFSLRQSPLTYLSAPTPSGTESTLEVRVDDIRWREAEGLAGLRPTERRFVTRADEDGVTSVVFGNGTQGARPSTGAENVRARYRNGIGKAGNAGARQISLLATRPLGVKSVINPLRASGGADPESRDQARRNVPVPLGALDRLVSVSDYADFARTFGGIGKASATRLSDGRRNLVHLTIAGADDIPVDLGSDLHRNLRAALHHYGDPHQLVDVVVRELMLLVMTAQVRLLPDYLWEAVEPRIRAALLDAFGFEKRELGQDVTLSEVVAVMHRVDGVAYVDVDVLDAVAEGLTPKKLGGLAARLQRSERIVVRAARVERTKKGVRLRPAQLAYLSPALPETLLLTERTA